MHAAEGEERRGEVDKVIVRTQNAIIEGKVTTRQN